MKRRSRLSRSRDFDAVYRHGRSVSNRYLVLYSFIRPAESDTDAPPRLGLAVSRTVGGAVERNRAKRLLREAFDEVAHELDRGHDYVLVVRPGFADAAAAREPDFVTACVAEVFVQAKALAGAGRR